MKQKRVLFFGIHKSSGALFHENRKGSHIDVIISFIIFVGFIVFLYAILQPTVASHQDKNSLLSPLYYKIIGNATGNFTKVYFNIDQQSQKCVSLSNFFTAAGIGANVTIMNLNGDVIPAYVSDNDLWFDWSALTGSFYAVYSPYYPSLPPNNLNGCNNLKQDQQNGYYSLLQEVNYSPTFPFEANLVSLIKDYDNNYNTVKNYFDVAPSDNFGFNFTYQNQTSVGTNDNISSLTSVYSELFPVVYMDMNGSLQAGALVIRAW